jgi:DNA (cytosine-5)-methyltransferase 1
LGMSKNFAYYNELDKNAAAWLRELIKMGLIADGIVDERSITEVSPNDLRGFNQCHWFAGVGGWSYSLRLAGIPDSYPVWTASLPCQPFSSAGKQLGKADERHLLPHYIELVRQCKPNLQIGEQVEGAIRHGWLDDLQTTMEAEGYAVGHCVLGAHSLAAPHIRQRLYWVADSCGKGLEGRERAECADKQSAGQDGMAGWMADSENRNGRTESRFSSSDAAESWNQSGRCGESGGLADSSSERHKKQPGIRRILRETPSDDSRKNIAGTGGMGESGVDWIYCRDNKYRPIKRGLKPTIPSIKSSTFKVVDGIPRGMGHGGNSCQPINANETQEARVMRLKGYGNAIVPQVAAEFIRAFMEIA